MSLPAFRCKSCGRLEPAAAAGENPLPHACSVCGEGIRFNARGIKFTSPENWEVLADLPDAVLAAHGLSREVVGRHVLVTAQDGPGTQDRT